MDLKAHRQEIQRRASGPSQEAALDHRRVDARRSGTAGTGLAAQNPCLDLKSIRRLLLASLCSTPSQAVDDGQRPVQDAARRGLPVVTELRAAGFDDADEIGRGGFGIVYRCTQVDLDRLSWSVGWSYDLCTPAEQQLWGQLSAFAGSFELEAAEDICDGDLAPDELLDLLSALVDKSILPERNTTAWFDSGCWKLFGTTVTSRFGKPTNTRNCAGGMRTGTDDCCATRRPIGSVRGRSTGCSASSGRG